jgi:uncharacterized protein YjiS (DUF1127 family)
MTAIAMTETPSAATLAALRSVAGQMRAHLVRQVQRRALMGLLDLDADRLDDLGVSASDVRSA